MTPGDDAAPGAIDAALRIALAGVNDAIIVTSPVLDDPGPLIRYVNPAFTRMTGYAADEVIGASPRILQGPQTSRSMLDAMRSALAAGRPFQGEAVNYRRDGTEYLVEWLITPSHGPDGRIEQWVSIQRDITDRRRLETTLIARDERLQSIVESARDYAIFLTDSQDRITDWWAGAAAVYGWTAQQAVGHPAAITFTEEDQAAGVPGEEVAGASRDGIVPNVRWHRHADGHHIFIEGSVRALRGQDGGLLGFLKIGQDVTARRLADKRLLDSEARLTRAVTAARMSTWEWDAVHDVLSFSIGTELLFGRPEGSMASVAAVIRAIHPEDRPAVRAAFERAWRGMDGGGLQVEFRVPLPDGQVRWLLAAGQGAGGSDGASGRVAGVTQDITERREADERIAHIARHDGLTDLINRGALHEQLADLLLDVQPGQACAVLALDLDDFKGINDMLGHAGGDAVLRSVAARLRYCVREADLVARLGGDEFVVVQLGLRQPASAEALAARIIAQLGRPHVIEGQQVHAGVSIGIALAPADGNEVDQVLRYADLALYDAKRQNGHCHRFFQPVMQARLEQRRQAESDLRQALHREEFELHYQPIVELPGRKIVGFEALVRWRHPERGLIPPGEFIGLAEETGLIRSLGTWILGRACADATRWPSHLRVAVNLSVRQFPGGGLPEVVGAALDVAGLAPGRLELEITETLLLEDAEETLGTLHRLRERGVSISMDDFGTGYSSLGYLARFPFDKVKIDRSFIAAAAARERASAAIIRAAVGLCKSLDIVVVAEGIETATQLEHVIHLGCDEGQGFLFARPCPATDVADLLRT